MCTVRTHAVVETQKPIQGRLKNLLQSFSDDLYSSRRQAYNHGRSSLYGFNTTQVRGFKVV